MLPCFADHRSLCNNLVLLLFFFIFYVLVTTSSACSNGSCQVLDACAAAMDCAPGLYCGNCPSSGATQPICTRAQAIIPTTIINGLPFNKYTWLVTHNSFSNVNAAPVAGVQRLTFYNQEDTVTNQLNNGVRGLMLDMYDFENDIWLCHSFRGQCFNFTAFQPAINVLKEVEAFLSANPTEIVTIIIEDYVHTTKGLTNLFTMAGLDKYWYPVSKMPKKGNDWPTVTEMVQDNHRLLVFTSDSSKEAKEGIAYQWKYFLENESGDPGVKGSCPNRKESKPLDSKSASLFLQNYFPTYPVEADSCKENSGPLAAMVGTCYKAAGNLMPTFLAVNFYMRSDGGGVFDIIDRMNGQTLCGCNTVTACQAGAPFGSCKNVAVPSRSPPINNTPGTGSFTGSVQFTRSASTVKSPNHLFFFLVSFPLLAFWL
ncbi:PI-PLC X domain-containing protein At5g67130 [Humulus lupulus]|uniref:PI-PLC X domain-containing protein At5g67130 n=1 Tax=Humulus lupulus TaxID=3486 RepID=UPI002B413B5A|nr:PI-PLC X domain-containing protein At5g67130 [Humulus lupulus]XP_062101953.1 PI-PLC X domain-containing protein At5g67130 [Humulus lupulus]